MKKHLITILALCLSIYAYAQESETVFNFLRVPVSAHAAALGGDNISLIDDDATLAITNPALLGSVSDKTITIGYMNYMSGVGIYSASFSHIINDKATVAGAAQYLNYGKISERNSNNDEIGSFTPSDLCLQGIFSYTLADKLIGGISAKFLYSKIASYSSTAAAIDLGLNYYSSEKDFSASIAVRNLGGQLSAYDEEFEKLPVDVLVGISQGIHSTPFIVHFTFSHLNDWGYAFLRHLDLGLDVKLCPQFYVAGGYNLRLANDMKVTTTVDGDTEESSHGAGLSIGAGLILEKFKLNVSYGKYHISSSSLMFNAAYTL